MNKLIIARFMRTGLNAPIMIGDAPYEFGLFGCADMSSNITPSNLGGESKVSQSRTFLDSLFCRFRDFNNVEKNSHEAWERSNIDHLNELLMPLHGFSVAGSHNFVATLTPTACDGGFYVSCWKQSVGIEVVPIHEVLLSNTLFLLVRKPSPVPSA